MRDTIYCIYRIYTAEERPDPDQRVVFYGWTDSKDVEKAFFLQRSKKKYKSVRLDEEDAIEIYADLPQQFEEMALDYVELRSVQDQNQIVPFFTTMTELQETEIRIQRMVRDVCSFPHPSREIIQAFIHIDRKYGDALHFIGFRPPQVDELYDSADQEDDITGDTKTLAQIETAYMGGFEYPDIPPTAGKIPGLTGIDEPCKRVLYSLEAFIKVLKEDL